MSTERERCPTCDHEMATERDKDDATLCWRAYNEYCSHPPVDWRARALAAEAQLAVGDVRPLVEAHHATVTALAKWYWADRDGLHHPERRRADWIRYTTAGDRYALRAWARRCLRWLRAPERTEGRAGDGDAKRG